MAAALLLLTACGSAETRQITYVLAAAQQRLGDTPVKLLATAHPGGQELLVFYQFRKEPKGERPSCGSGAVLVRPGQPDKWLTDEHTCAQDPSAIAYASTGALGEYILSYGLVFDPRAARVTVTFGNGAPLPAEHNGGAWWVLRRQASGSSPDQVTAYDRDGKVLQAVRPPAGTSLRTTTSPSGR